MKMPDIGEQLRTYIDTIAPPVSARRDAAQPWWRARPLVAALVGAAVVAIPTLLLWGFFGRAAKPEPTVPPAVTTSTVPPTTTTTPEAEVTSTTRTVVMPTTTSPEPETIGSWTSIPDAPWAYPRTIRAWTGTELLVFPQYVYGIDDVPTDTPAAGIAYEPTTATWRELTPIPELRGQPATAWTGSELLVWGGMVNVSAEGGYQLSNTGFSYDPAADRWAPIPPAPLEPQAFPFHVWTGEELIVWGGSVVIDDIFLSGTTTGAAYDPAAGTWRMLPESPLGARNPGVGVWTGTEMIIGGNGDHTDGDASWGAYDPASNAWRQLPDPPVRAGEVRGGIWTGTEVIFSEIGGNGVNMNSDLYALNPATGEWRQAIEPRQTLYQAGLVWTGGYVVFWGESGNQDEPFTQVAYDPVGDRWYPLTSSPLQPRFADGDPTLIAPGTVLIWGGSGYDSEQNADGAILSLNGDPGAAAAPTPEDTELATSLFLLTDPSRAAELPWDPDGVGLGLGSIIYRTAAPAELTDPSSWVLNIDYAGAAAPLSILDAITRLAERDDITVRVGPHNHCAGPARPAPAGYETLRRISIQPAGIESCLEWWTIDLFVTDDGLISAVTYDLWEP
jgi:hypothetical protein